MPPVNIDRDEIKITRLKGDYGLDSIVIEYRLYTVARFIVPSIATVEANIDCDCHSDRVEKLPTLEPLTAPTDAHPDRYGWKVEPSSGPEMYTVYCCMTDHAPDTECNWTVAPGFTFTSIRPKDNRYTKVYIDDQRVGFIVTRQS